uniref:Phosphatidylinositol 4-kinase type 2 n=1 Tax=Panagrellus redivivus TaxID=6233 RepID=A0A7E4ZVX1_PANRE
MEGVNKKGYLSEAGASLVDQKLGLNVVPKTAVVAFAAPTFNYSALDRGFARSKERIRSRYPDLGRRFRRIGLPPKKGSFQLFVSGYEDATYWLRQWDISPEQAPPPATRQQFKLQFERLVILDYIIRNTDRGNDNWLIKYELAEARPITDTSSSVKSNTGSPVPPRDKSPEPPAIQEDVIVDLSDSGNPVPGNDAPLGGDAQVQTSNTDVTSVEPNISEISMPTETPVVLSTVTSETDLEHVSMPTVAIAAIDNGLAFPFKHPDEWRSYPYQWSALPIAQEPFSEETINEFLPKLDDTDFVRELGQDLKRIFETDKSFNMRMFNKQLSVMRGQIFNLREALRSRKTPYQLVMMPPQYMIEVKRKHVRPSNVLHVRTSGEESHSGLSDSAVGHSDVAGPSSTSAAPTASQANDESDPKSWNNTFKQKVQTRSAFFRMW